MDDILPIINLLLIVLLGVAQYVTIRNLGWLIKNYGPNPGARDDGVGPRLGENINLLLRGVGFEGDQSSLLFFCIK